MQKDKEKTQPEFFIEKCKQHNLKLTPQRMSIYHTVVNLNTHPSADEVFKIVKKEFANISFDTVNRTLLTFSEIGIVKTVESYRSVRRFDPNTQNHHHLHCNKCGKIIDFYSEAYDNLNVPKNINQQFIIQNKRVVLMGICMECQNK